MSDRIRTRFAPSPTGMLHVGGARTALFNWLFARHHEGDFVLRIEDTDQARHSPEALEAVLRGLRWLGLDLDEGPEKGGNFGPYFQSERHEIHTEHFEKLVAANIVYQEEDGSWRFKSARGTVVVEDLICGQIVFDLGNPDSHPDLTIRRADGSFTFHFVNVVDDLTMKISHVIRGEDHLSNTPKHIELYYALEAAPPAFAHIPLILNPDGAKMSKRDSGAALNDYMKRGYLAEAFRNYLCLLGWSPKDDREKMDVEEIIQIFDLANINLKNAAFDQDKLDWLQGEYARELKVEDFEQPAREELKRAGLDPDNYPEQYVREALRTCEGKFTFFYELPTYAGFYFTDEPMMDPEAAKQHLVPENEQSLKRLQEVFNQLDSFDAAAIEQALKQIAEELQVKPKKLVHPLRLAVTGKTAGPSLYHLLEVLGKEQVSSRIDRARASFSNGASR